MANLARDLAIAAGLAVGDDQECLSNLGLERGAGAGERDIEDLALPSEILGQLPLGPDKSLKTRFMTSIPPCFASSRPADEFQVQCNALTKRLAAISAGRQLRLLSC
jgi:hypothetical protein